MAVLGTCITVSAYLFNNSETEPVQDPQLPSHTLTFSLEPLVSNEAIKQTWWQWHGVKNNLIVTHKGSRYLVITP